MVAVDTNLLVYAHRREVKEHEAAKQLVQDLAEGSSTWAIPWPCLYEFFSVVTNPRIWKKTASSSVEASAQIDGWCASPSLRLLREGEDFMQILLPFMRLPKVRGPIVHDARVAAICIAHGVGELLTRDRDFSLFPGLKTRNPL